MPANGRRDLIRRLKVNQLDKKRGQLINTNSFGTGHLDVFEVH